MVLYISSFNAHTAARETHLYPSVGGAGVTRCVVFPFVLQLTVAHAVPSSAAVCVYRS
jgi:hypothetical protein